jgi:DNA polymerase-3 subunit gamma/tau
LTLLPIFSKVEPSKSTKSNISATVAQPEVQKPTITEHVTHRPTTRRVSGRDAFATPSISGALREDSTLNDVDSSYKSDENPSASVSEVKPFTHAKLVEVWKIFVGKIEAPQLKSALSSRDPNLNEGWRIEYELDTELQLQRLILELKPKLLGFLRRELSNESIEIEFLISTHSDDKHSVPYTESEKWQALVEKYPALATLKSKFGLDFEQ